MAAVGAPYTPWVVPSRSLFRASVDRLIDEDREWSEPS